MDLSVAEWVKGVTVEVNGYRRTCYVLQLNAANKIIVKMALHINH
jgi:hypothetical protein